MNLSSRCRPAVQSAERGGSRGVRAEGWNGVGVRRDASKKRGQGSARKRQIEFSIKTGRKVLGPQTRARPLRDGIRQNLLAVRPCRGRDNRGTVRRRDSGWTHARLARPANGEPPASRPQPSLRPADAFFPPTTLVRRRRTTVYGLKEPFPVRRFRPRRRRTPDAHGGEGSHTG